MDEVAAIGSDASGGHPAKRLRRQIQPWRRIMTAARLDGPLDWLAKAGVVALEESAFVDRHDDRPLDQDALVMPPNAISWKRPSSSALSEAFVRTAVIAAFPIKRGCRA
jgi:hypothetical protein